jgi:hypothetical protein
VIQIKRVELYVTEIQNTKLRDIAKRKQVSKSELIRRIVDEWFDKENRKMNLYQTKQVQLGICSTCGKKVSTYVAPIDFNGRDGTRHDVIQIDGHCGVPGHATKTAYYTYAEMIGRDPITGEKL